MKVGIKISRSRTVPLKCKRKWGIKEKWEGDAGLSSLHSLPPYFSSRSFFLPHQTTTFVYSLLSQRTLSTILVRRRFRAFPCCLCSARIYRVRELAREGAKAVESSEMDTERNGGVEKGRKREKEKKEERKRTIEV